MRKDGNMQNQVYHHTKQIVDKYGVRVAGSQQSLDASDYVADYYHKLGIQVETHEFEVPVCCVDQSEFKVKREGKWEELKHAPVLFSKQTGDEGKILPLVYIEDGSVSKIKEKDIKGKAVLICRDVLRIYPDLNMYKRLHEYGAAALIYTTNDGQWEVPYVYSNFEMMNEDYIIPTVIIHHNTALALLRDHVSEVSLKICFDVTMKKARNVIGMIEGTDKKEECVVICAHLDSVPESKGATDDAAGVAMIMEMARYYKEQADHGKKPRRTMRFIAWSGHECGLHGSKYYLMDNPDVFRSVRFVFNYDIVGNILNNYSMCGACDDETIEMLQNLLAELELDWAVNRGPIGVDPFNFAVREVPQMTITSGFNGSNHSPLDDMDLISPDGFASPLRFSKALLDWAASVETIRQGYPQDLNEKMRISGAMYGWGLFDLV